MNPHQENYPSDVLPPAKNPFLVPEHYFEQLEAQIFQKIYVEDKLNLHQGKLTVPQDYFNSLEEKLMSEVKLEENLIPQKFEKDIPFSVPDGYFEKLEDRIFAAATKKPTIQRFSTIRKWSVGIAASVLISTTAFFFWSQQSKPQNHSFSWDEIPDDLLIEYASMNIASFDDEDLKIILEDAELLPRLDIENVSEQDLEDILSN